jgi:hypothetical protein
VRVGYLLALLVLAASTPAMSANCTQTFSLGTIGVPSVTGIGDSFGTPGSFVDCYNFTLGASGNVTDLVFTLDPLLNKLDIDLTSIVLSTGSLVVSGAVARAAGLWNLPVGYAGVLIATGPGSSVPEPGTLALFGIGLLGVAFATRRRATKYRHSI